MQNIPGPQITVSGRPGSRGVPHPLESQIHRPPHIIREIELGAVRGVGGEQQHIAPPHDAVLGAGLWPALAIRVAQIISGPQECSEL